MAALLCRQNVELLDDGKPLSTLLAHMTALGVTKGHADGAWRGHEYWARKWRRVRGKSGQLRPQGQWGGVQVQGVRP